MLMSLTIRFRPSWPPDSWGTTSVVAIPIPSFKKRAENSPARVCWIQEEANISLYGGIGGRVPQITRLKPRGTCFETRVWTVQDSVLKNCAMFRNLSYREPIN